MPYIKRLASIINGADSCGGGMKKQGLVYGSDHARVKGKSKILKSQTAIQYKFTLYGAGKKECCLGVQRTTVGAARLVHGTQHAR
jgi:hypothetical protein